MFTDTSTPFIHNTTTKTYDNSSSLLLSVPRGPELHSGLEINVNSSCWLPLRWMMFGFLGFLHALTCVSRVGSGAVEEAGGSWYTEVGHPRSVSIHGGRDGVVVGLLRRWARHVATRRHAVGVTGVTWEEKGQCLNFLCYTSLFIRLVAAWGPVYLN